MGVFICPVCGEKLEISGKSYVCAKNHSFDISKSGYVRFRENIGAETFILG